MLIYSHPGLQGMELWHGIARHATLAQLRDDKPAYFAGLAAFLADLHAGRARTADGDDLSAAAGFERLILTGGDAAAASAHLAWPHELCDPGPFAARAGAEAIWRELGWRQPVAIDLGQTRLKGFTPSGSQSFERDLALLPPGRDSLDPPLARARLRAFVGRAIPPGAGGVLLALPAAISANGHAGPSTYPGLHGPIGPLFGSLFPNIPWAVCNDAVLAARGHPPPNGEKTLVLTLGFGVGAALWQYSE